MDVGRRPGTGWYDDACGTAFAMELLGERWSLLIVRELMFGARRFGELKASLTGISSKSLTERLGGLVSAGIAKRSPTTPAGSYELTPWGMRAEGAIRELGRWAVLSPAHDPTLPLSAAALMMSMKTLFVGDGEATVGFTIGEESFVAVAQHGRLEIRRGDAFGAEALIEGTPHQIAALLYDGRGLAGTGEGQPAIRGDTGAVARFARLFEMPEKILAP